MSLLSKEFDKLAVLIGRLVRNKEDVKPEIADQVIDLLSDFGDSILYLEDYSTAPNDDIADDGVQF